MSNEIFHFKGPGYTIGFKSNWFPSKFVQFDFHEEVVLNGLVITTSKENYLKRFRVRANRDLNDPHILSNEEPIVNRNLVRIARVINDAKVM